MFEYSTNTAKRFIDVLYRARRQYDFLLLAFAVMPDHVHAILLPSPQNTISDVVRFIKGPFAREYNAARNRRGQVWQSGFYERVLRGDLGLQSTVAYIDDNPWKAGLAASAVDYLFSSASGKYELDDVRFHAGGWPS